MIEPVDGDPLGGDPRRPTAQVPTAQLPTGQAPMAPADSEPWPGASSPPLNGGRPQAGDAHPPSPYGSPAPDPGATRPASPYAGLPAEADAQPYAAAQASPGPSSGEAAGTGAAGGGAALGGGAAAARPATRAGLRRRRGKSRNRPPTRLQAALSAGFEVAVVLGMALALSLLIKTFLVQAFFIPSQSMQDTLLVGDRVLVSKLTPEVFSLHRGDVVVFKDPGGWLQSPPEVSEGAVRHGLRAALTFVGLLPQDSGEHLIKRVIGLPGDTVTCCDARGRLMVNGTAINETYVRAGNTPSDQKFTVTVKKDHLWVMGDNRSESADSRFHTELDGGQVPVDDVVGKAFAVVWPLNRFGGVNNPPAVFATVPSGASSP